MAVAFFGALAFTETAKRAKRLEPRSLAVFPVDSANTMVLH